LPTLPTRLPSGFLNDPRFQYGPFPPRNVPRHPIEPPPGSWRPDLTLQAPVVTRVDLREIRTYNQKP
jgi:hypothetical protein